MAAIVVIPARYDSTRFPGKPLALLKGKPLIQHVYEGCLGASLVKDVMVATDSEAILEKVLSFSGKAVMTSSKHLSGTDRVAEVASQLDYDIIVNVQGDEPLINPQMIDDVVDLLSDSSADMGTLTKKIDNPEDIMDPNVVKVVFDKDNFALYFSRSPIPYHRDLLGSIGFNVVVKEKSLPDDFVMYKHVGIYSYRKEVLLRLSSMRQTRLEEIERLEQLRALENGFKIKVKETIFETIGVDTPEDMERVEEWLNTYL